MCVRHPLFRISSSFFSVVCHHRWTTPSLPHDTSFTGFPFLFSFQRVPPPLFHSASSRAFLSEQDLSRLRKRTWLSKPNVRVLLLGLQSFDFFILCEQLFDCLRNFALF